MGPPRRRKRKRTRRKIGTRSLNGRRRSQKERRGVRRTAKRKANLSGGQRRKMMSGKVGGKVGVKRTKGRRSRNARRRTMMKNITRRKQALVVAASMMIGLVGLSLEPGSPKTLRRNHLLGLQGVDERRNPMRAGENL